MRLRTLLIAAAAVLTACSSNAQHGGPSPTPGSADSNVVDGITIPPPYVTPAGTVVPGLKLCPVGLGRTLTAAAHGAAFGLNYTASTHLITCRYQSRPAAKASCSKSTIVINTEPSAFVAFDRWNVETGQNSMWSSDPALLPIPVSGIGVEAEWVPELRELGTADSATWVSVFMTCPGRPLTQARALAESLARQALAATG